MYRLQLLPLISLACLANAFTTTPSHNFHRHSKMHGHRAEASSDGWKMHKSLTGQNLINYFNYDIQASDNDGVANYVDGSKDNLVYVDGDGKVRIAVDTTEYVESRKSVRMVSSETYNPTDNRLFIFDIQHIPAVCGVWPALWFSGDNWPNDGEIDVIEGVNMYSTNTMSIHTGSGCTMSQSTFPQSKLAKSGATNCDANKDYQGCGVVQNSNTSYGVGSNNAGGSTYALQYNEDGVYMWQWNAGKGPSDIAAGAPTPSKWGEAVVSFSSSTCDMNSHFKDISLIINTNIAGFFPDGVWSQANAGGQVKSCKDMTGFKSVYDYAVKKGSVFGNDAQWVINGIYIYRK